MFFHNFFNNIPCQPAAFVSLFCGKEPLQDSQQNLGGNPLAAIRDGQEQELIFIYSKSILVMHVELPETLAIIESIVYKSNGFAISPLLLKPTLRKSLNRIDGYKFKEFKAEVIAP